MKSLQAPRGTHDLLPEAAEQWSAVEASIKNVLAAAGFREIRTPLFEESDLFKRGVGEATDIVSKEMFTFSRGEEEYVLRPEGTASVVRAYLEHGFHMSAPFQKFFYIGPMFRAERPQKGRYRQFHTAAIEVLGTTSPLADAECILLGLDVYESVGLTGVTLKMNSIGCAACRPVYRETLKSFLDGQISRLCGDCKDRLTRNVMRVLDCKKPPCREATKDAPAQADHLCPACRSHEQVVLACLSDRGVTWAMDPRLVRGLDYYTRTVFEYVHAGLGSQDAVGGGGRYDGLVEIIGGPATGAVGWGLGLERILLARGEALGTVRKRHGLYVASVGDQAARRVLALARDLRKSLPGLRVETDLEGKSVKAQMRNADKTEARWVAVVGDQELASGQVKLKDLGEAGGERIVGLSDLGAELKTALGKEKR